MAGNHENSRASIFDPDISAFQKYMDTPWNHEKGFMRIARDAPMDNQTKNFLILNVKEVNESPERQKALDAFGDHFKDFAEHNILARLSEKGDPRHNELRDGFHDFIDHMKDRIDTNIIGLREAGGGIADLQLNIALVDPRATSLSERIGSLFYHEAGPVFGKAQESYYAEFVRHHEAAHSILGLQEAGADFAAAAMTLKANPEARETLQIMADLRISEGMAGGYENFTLYGAECQLAIQEVLQMPQEELEKLDAKSMYKMAERFDAMTAGNEAIYIRSQPSAEFSLHEKIQGWDAQDRMSFVSAAATHLGEGIKSTLKEVWDSASKGKLPEFTSIGAYLDTMRQIVDDMNTHPLAMQKRAQKAIDDPQFSEKSIARDLDRAVTRLSGYVYGTP